MNSILIILIGSLFYLGYQKANTKHKKILLAAIVVLFFCWVSMEGFTDIVYDTGPTAPIAGQPATCTASAGSAVGSSQACNDPTGIASETACRALSSTDTDTCADSANGANPNQACPDAALITTSNTSAQNKVLCEAPSLGTCSGAGGAGLCLLTGGQVGGAADAATGVTKQDCLIRGINPAEPLVPGPCTWTALAAGGGCTFTQRNRECEYAAAVTEVQGIITETGTFTGKQSNIYTFPADFEVATGGPVPNCSAGGTVTLPTAAQISSPAFTASTLNAANVATFYPCARADSVGTGAEVTPSDQEVICQDADKSGCHEDDVWYNNVLGDLGGEICPDKCSTNTPS